MTTTEQTLTLMRAYYDCWGAGFEALDSARLRTLLAPDLMFESPVNRRTGVDSFLTGITGFSKTLKSLRVLQLLAADSDGAAVYDCSLTMPVSELRCAEFFRIEGERIKGIKLVFDATGYRKVG
jgi:hypothetical protein